MKVRILFLSRWCPYPANNGSKIRIFNAIRQLSRWHDVALLTFGDAAEVADASIVPALERYCSSVRIFPFRDYRPTSARALRGLFSPRPRYLVDTRSEELEAAIRENLDRFRPEVIVASQLHMAPYVDSERGVPAILEELELATFHEAVGQAGFPIGRARAALSWLKLAAYARGALPEFAACTVVSAPELDLLRRVAPGYDRASVIPNAVDLSAYDGEFGEPRANSLVFSGALTYEANHDALRYFLSEIYPLIQRAIPSVSLTVTGTAGTLESWSLPRHAGVQLVGRVPDVRPTIAGSWASVVPLRRGGGTRLKILEALAMGTPVVSTRKGAEGLDVTDGEDILLADDPRGYAAKAVQLLQSSELRRRLASAGKVLVREKYDWSRVGGELNHLVEVAARDRRFRPAGR